DDHLYFGLLQPDGHYEMLFAGPNLDRLLGGELPDSADEINATWQGRIDRDDLAAYRACEADLLAGRPSQVDYRVHGLDGRTRWIRARVWPEQLGDGSVRFAGILSDITQQREAEDDLRRALADLADANARLDAARGRAIELAMTDALTGAANRRHVDRVLTELLRTGGPPIGVLLLDIDDFKDINDRHGHRVGDEVLIEIVARLERVMRPEDVVARWGGEEFLLVCRAEERESMHAVAERIRAVVSEAPFPTTAGAIPVTVSVGAVASDGRAQSPDPLVDAADEALLAAKRAGKNRIVVARRPPRTRIAA
ncbi:MAG: two-component system, cell cycle response regulator, partial [Pseudonocardiales bacterium]|nr:two-component system, cell cycle response regulator [Pseudonocardiales bacterium]